MLLAIDTASVWGGLALWDGDLVLEMTWRADRRQTAELLPHLDALLAAAGRPVIDRIAVVVGPGSFNGMRVGIATAQAFALAQGVPLVPVDALEALALPYRPLGPVAAIIPAGRDYAVAMVPINGPSGAPTIVTAADLLASIDGARIAVSETTIDGLEIPVVAGAIRRPASVAAIGAKREPGPIDPVYLRQPHITQPKGKDPR